MSAVLVWAGVGGEVWIGVPKRVCVIDTCRGDTVSDRKI